MERRDLACPDQQDSVPASKIRLDLFWSPLNQIFCLCLLKLSFSIYKTCVGVQAEQCNYFLHIVVTKCFYWTCVLSDFSEVFHALAQGMAGRPMDQAPEGI